jgi:hypothetical protein
VRSVRAEVKISLIDDPAVIRRIVTHLGLWRERKGNERGTAPLEKPASDAHLAYDPVNDPSACGHAQAGGWRGNDEPAYTYHRSRDPHRRGPAGAASASGSGPHFLA